MTQQKFASNVIGKRLTFGGPAHLGPYSLNSHCEAALLQKPTICVHHDKCEADIPNEDVKYLIQSLMLLYEHKHHEVFLRRKEETYGLMKEIGKRFGVKLPGHLKINTLIPQA